MSLYTPISAQVAAGPARVAVQCGPDRLSYAELDDRVRRLATRLAQDGVGIEDRVGVCLTRGVELVVAMLGVFAAGAVYLPLDPDLPAGRLSRLVQYAAPRLVITDQANDHRVPSSLPRLSSATGVGPLAPLTGAEPDSAAYIMYTSGSTGAPKGVVVSHAAVARDVAALAEALELTERDRVLQFAGVGIDTSVEQVLSALVSGAAVVVRGPLLWEPRDFLRIAAELDVTVANLPTSYFHQVVEFAAGTAVRPARLRVVMPGGEALSTSAAARWNRTGPGARLLNVYGATEAVISVALHDATQVGPDRARGAGVPLGRLLKDRTAHVLDRSGRVVPVGVFGELYLGGPALARGYHGRPGLTADRFVPDPFGPPGSRLYRTGDLARFRSDGTLQYLGRADDQVKIRGVRIEPAEVEAALMAVPGVALAAVRALPREDGDTWLVAYLAPEQGASIDPAAVRTEVAEQLPTAMVPARCVVLADMPITASGKIDRAALPDVDFTADPGRRPATEPERLLAQLWAGTLGLSEVGIDDDFFELGGHSLSASRLAARICSVFSVEVTVRTVFDHRTVAGFAEELNRLRRRVDSVPIGRVDAAPVGLPLSPFQRRLWFLQQTAPDSAVYHVPLAIRQRGPFDRGALSRAVRLLGDRHEILRGRFPVTSAGPSQEHGVADEIPVHDVDLRALPPDQREAASHVALAEAAAQPFDLTAGPLAKAHVIQVADEDHLLLLCVHHIACDARSVQVIAEELGHAYDSYARGAQPQLPATGVSYADYLRWQESMDPAWRESLDWWRTALDGVPRILELPVDRPRPTAQSYRGARLPVSIGQGVTRGLRALSRDQDATLFMTLLTVFGVVLHRYSNQPDLLVGAPVDSRSTPDLEHLVGPLLNTVPLRVRTTPEDTFASALARTRDVVLDSLAHGDVAFDVLVDALAPQRDLANAPLVQVVFAFEEANSWSDGAAADGEPAEPVALDLGTSKFDLTLSLVGHADRIEGFVEYSSDVFTEATVREWLAFLTELSERVADAAEQPIAHLLAPTERELARLVRTCVAADDTPAPHSSLVAGFAEQVKARPSAIACTAGESSLTYEELDRRANRLAHALLARGVRRGDLVGLCVQRTEAIIIGVLGVLRAGAAYVPLDSTYPLDRLSFLMADAQLTVLVADTESADLVAGVTGGLDHVLRLDRAGDVPVTGPDHDPGVPLGQSDLAYLIYTSGSTGKPKGVRVSHGNVLRLFSATSSTFGFGPDDVWSLFHSHAFDLSVWEMWGALLHGGRVVVVPWLVSRSPADFVALCTDQGVTVLSQTPSAFRGFVDAARNGASRASGALRHIVFGGETLDVTSVRRWWELAGPDRPRLINMYGITETTVHVTAHHMVPSDLHRSATPVGRPIPDLALHVLDRDMRPVPVGVVGEIYVGGAGLADGYHRRPGLTATRFVPDPWGPRGARLYRSGDLARLTPDGTLEYFGRADDQVKVRGIRVEPGEVEAALASHPSVRQAAVAARPGPDGRPRLVGFVVAADPAVEPKTGDLRAHVAATLPAALVPSVLYVVDGLPITTNGKLDRKQLPESGPGFTTETPVPPKTPVERAVAMIWATVLGSAVDSVHTSFFELGGDSMLAVRTVNLIGEIFQIELGVSTLFSQPTVAGLAGALQAGEATPGMTTRLAELFCEVSALSADRARAQITGTTGEGR